MKPNYTYPATVVRVVDGDTVILLIDVGFYVHVRQSVRLLDIYAPELSTIDGQKAKIALQRLYPSGCAVFVQTRRRDKYGRWLGRLWRQ